MIWQQYGTGQNESILPIHQIATNLKPAKSNVLIRVHVITWGDMMTKVGKKHAEIQCNQVEYHTNFGETS